MKKRILIVNACFDVLRRGARPTSIPQAMGPVYLAGAFSDRACELRLYNEQASGPLVDEAVYEWADMIVLTGLTCAFDRMRHLAAYARTKNPRVVTVAGGPAVRAMPRHSRRFFDYACTGDVEEMRKVAREAFGAAAMAEAMRPRFDLAHWLSRFSYIESSRYCNFRCAFCSLTAEGHAYQRYDLDDLRRHILDAGRRQMTIFIDNNFYGNDRAFFLARLALLKELYASGRIAGWCALVTNDFFLRDDNLRLARESGCKGLFSGVESFDPEAIRNFQKLQNLQMPQVEMIQRSVEAGIAFSYGLIFDVTTRRLAEMREEIDFVLRTPDIPLPNYISLAIPLLGTPFFRDVLAKGLLLPDTRLRDLDTTTLALRPLDPIPNVAAFLRALPGMHGYRARVLRHSAGLVRRYRRHLTAFQIHIALSGAFMLCAPYLKTRPRGAALEHNRSRTFVSTTETLDPLYTPAFRVDRRYESYFEPTMITDHEGRLNEALVDDLRGAVKIGSHAAPVLASAGA